MLHGMGIFTQPFPLTWILWEGSNYQLPSINGPSGRHPGLNDLYKNNFVRGNIIRVTWFLAKPKKLKVMKFKWEVVIHEDVMYTASALVEFSDIDNVYTYIYLRIYIYM